MSDIGPRQYYDSEGLNDELNIQVLEQHQKDTKFCHEHGAGGGVISQNEDDWLRRIVP
jgi:hypothetical protein